MKYDILTDDRLRQIAADDHKEGTVGEARNMARELLEVRHALKNMDQLATLRAYLHTGNHVAVQAEVHRMIREAHVGSVADYEALRKKLLAALWVHAPKDLALAELEAVLVAARALLDANNDDEGDRVHAVMEAVSAFDLAVGYVRR